MYMKTNSKLVGSWALPATITENHFKFKSLSNWALNVAVGCSHGCRFCYVPSASAIKLSGKLSKLGIADPDSEWGRYVFVRQWDEKRFLASLSRAEKTPIEELSADGNRAIILCSTTDPYMVLADREMNSRLRFIVRRSLELILEHSTLNVRILTRGPAAKLDLDLFKKFGNRLIFGMSLPTLNPTLARLYEPDAPAPMRRLETMQLIRAAGVNVFVAMAPTPPECDEADLGRTLEKIRELDPVTVFHEPINLRAENVERIRAHAVSLGCESLLNAGVFSTRDSWRSYAIESLRSVEHLAAEAGLGDRLHLWPDATLGSKLSCAQQHDPFAFRAWLELCWNRISEWPGGESDPKVQLRNGLSALIPH